LRKIVQTKKEKMMIRGNHTNEETENAMIGLMKAFFIAIVVLMLASLLL
jgi:hypothetical protein